MTDLLKTAQILQSFLMNHNCSFCIIGGIAVIRWGEPRFTQDVDICLYTGFGDEKKYIEYLLQRYRARIDEPKQFAEKNRVLLLQSEDGIAIDIALAGLPYEERLIDRSSTYDFIPSIQLRTCSAEDLIVLKAFADRDQDWADIRGVIIRQDNKLDWYLIKEELAPLCDAKEQPEILDRLEKLRLYIRKHCR